MMVKKSSPKSYVHNITNSGLSIYNSIEIGDPHLWVPAPELELLLNQHMRGLSLSGLALRTRSKLVKSEVCRALGYPIPEVFRKTQPRFPGQLLDTYTQKANNLQIWNEDLAPTRRYAIIGITKADEVHRVKVVTGDSLAKLDTTGTLTQKYQARLICGSTSSELISDFDTPTVTQFLDLNGEVELAKVKPTENPSLVLPIATVFERLLGMVGFSFADQGHDQERRRGDDLHTEICRRLGYSNLADDGQFPDVRHQLIEVKLQTSPTIDLGLVRPNSMDPLDVPQIKGNQIRHCDVRYAIFYATTDGVTVTLTHFFLSSGVDFFSRFPQFQGKVLNKKLQIPLPRDFFD